MTHISMRSKSLGPESRIHFGACVAMAGIQLGDQDRIINQLGARNNRGHRPKVDQSSREDPGDAGQPLAQRDRIAQPPAGSAAADTQGRSHFGDDVLMAVDGPVHAIDIILRVRDARTTRRQRPVLVRTSRSAVAPHP